VLNLSSPILEALPAVHVTIIGVVAAFFSAFAIYAYQKVNDAKEKMDAALKRSVSIATPTSMMFGGNNIYLNGDGTLNWDDAGKGALRRASMLYSYLDYEEKYGIPRNEYQHEPDADEVILACNDLFSLLTTIFTSYPFWNNNLVHIEGQTDKVSEACSKEFDLARIQEMQRIVGYLCWTWSTSSRSLMTLAAKGMEFSQQKKIKEQRDMFEQQMEMLEKQQGNMPQSEKDRIWAQFHQPHVHGVTNFQDVFSNFFGKAHLVDKEVIPLLAESLSSFTTYNETFRVRDTTLKVIALITFNLFFGVMLPLINLNLLANTNLERVDMWFSVFEYILLLITMLPYVWVCYYLYKKVKMLSFA
jgi:hypothetical protein